MVAGPGGGPAGFEHPGLLYRDIDEYLGVTTGFVRSALTAGDAVLVAVPGERLALLRAALTDVADRVTFADMAVAGRNPGRIIPGVLLAFAAAQAGRRVSIIGEPIWRGRSDLEYPACAAHEALINAVFADRDAAILCPYDAASLDDEVLGDAWRNHPTMIENEVRRPSDRYADPLATAARFNRALPPVPPDAPRLAYDGVDDLPGVRRFVVRHAGAAGLAPDRVDDLVLAVNELTANTIEHTDGGGTVSLWTEHGMAVCQVDDRGHLADPLAGRVPPPARAEGGRGLVLANQLCDLFRMHTGRAGTSIRLHMWP
ncbi:anti-sigma factor RsbA family regulatory protein [Amorphoplanes nipponensis]|uniref:Anti-sigma regulatory factor n=2 Tax=Actinoplanes nipponensis TaxID=135950 RepID=A0A919JQV8_9ACTN|nr:anti-sigma regulatory factor [Actinoplanes nipponensis]